MPFDWAAQKRVNRGALHSVFAVSAFYEDADVGPVALHVRHHTQLVRLGPQPGGYDAGMEEDVNRLVFSEPELTAALDGAGLTLRKHGTVTIPNFDARGDLVLSLDTLAPADGPVNVTWNVVQS